MTDFMGQSLPSRGTGMPLVKKFPSFYTQKVFTITMTLEI
jgi:hypothetical protein